GREVAGTGRPARRGPGGVALAGAVDGLLAGPVRREVAGEVGPALAGPGGVALGRTVCGTLAGAVCRAFAGGVGFGAPAPAVEAGRGAPGGLGRHRIVGVRDRL